MTDRHTHRLTDRQTPAILLSAPCYAIAMGQIIIADTTWHMLSLSITGRPIV